MMAGRFSQAARRLAVGAASLAAGQMMMLAVRGIYVICVTRVLGPELYGLLVYSQSWYLAFLPMASLGLAPVLIRLLGLGDPGSRQLAALAMRVMGLSAVASSIACAALIAFVEPDAQLRAVVMAFALALAARGAEQVAESVLVGHGHAARTLPVLAITRPLEPFVALAILAAGGGLLSLALLHSATWALQAVMQFRVARRLGLLAALPRPSGRLRALMALGFPQFAAQVATNILMQYVIIHHRWNGHPGLGQLAVLVQVFAMLPLLPLAALKAVLPALSRRQAADPIQAQAVGRLLVTASLIGTGAAALIALPLGPLVVPILIGEAFLPAAEAVWLAVLAAGVLAASHAASQQLQVQGRSLLLALGPTLGLLMLAGLLHLGDLQQPMAAFSTVLVGCLVSLSVMGIGAGLGGALWRAYVALGAAALVTYVMPSPVAAAGAGLLTLGLVSWGLRAVVLPRRFGAED